MTAPARDCRAAARCFSSSTKTRSSGVADSMLATALTSTPALANQAGSDCLSDLLQRALHGSHCIAAGYEEGRARHPEAETSRPELKMNLQPQRFAPALILRRSAGTLALAHNERAAARATWATGGASQCQVPTTTPLLSVPLVVVVPFDVPVRPPGGAVSVRTLPGGAREVTVMLS